MITTPGVTTSGAAAAGSDAVGQTTGSATLGKNDFLKLLVTQLTHQDPLNPLDQNQFLAQTAQFTQIEELQNIAQAIGDLSATTASSNVAQAATLLGRTVTVAGNDVTFDGASPVALPYTVAGATAPVQIQILDQQGNTVRTISASAAAPGAYTATWDGKDAGGNPMAAGAYYYRVSTPDPASGATVSAVQGVLTGFTVTGGALRYQLGTALVRPEDIIEVRQ
jgi:flagellar basal-body rod modification protein FlgD